MVLVHEHHDTYAHSKFQSELAMLGGSRSSVQLLEHGLEGDVGSFAVNDDLVFRPLHLCSEKFCGGGGCFEDVKQSLAPS